jgi:hypothetical protein
MSVAVEQQRRLTAIIRRSDIILTTVRGCKSIVAGGVLSGGNS